MLCDDKAHARRRRELNRPVVVKCESLSLADLPAAHDAAVVAWFDKLCELYDIDPAAQSRWEQLAMRLALEQFPDFALVSSKPKVGNPGTKEAVMNLFRAFESYTPPRGSRSKYKHFWRNHQAACEKCNIKNDRSLKDALRRARQQHEADRRGEELLIRHAMAKAFGTSA
jgi:hypothetical protein